MLSFAMLSFHYNLYQSIFLFSLFSIVFFKFILSGVYWSWIYKFMSSTKCDKFQPFFYFISRCLYISCTDSLELYLRMFGLLILSHVSLRAEFFFLQSFSLYSLGSIISVSLCSSLLFRSSVISIQLMSLSSSMFFVCLFV